MIRDHITHGGCYAALGPRFAFLFNYLRTHDLLTMPSGIHKIDGDDIFMEIKEYNTREPAVANWETHIRHADVQYILAGRERMEVTTARDLAVRVPYDAAKDRTFYKDVQPECNLGLEAGMFVALFPQDAHLASLTDGEISHNKKAVIKVRL